MTTTLSLTVDEEVAKKIEAVAKEKNTSVSALAEAHFVHLLQKENKGQKPLLLSLAGIIKKEAVSDEYLDEIKDEYLREKNGI